jgi:hypothetical protein
MDNPRDPETQSQENTNDCLNGFTAEENGQRREIYRK